MHFIQSTVIPFNYLNFPRSILYENICIVTVAIYFGRLCTQQAWQFSCIIYFWWNFNLIFPQISLLLSQPSLNLIRRIVFFFLLLGSRSIKTLPGQRIIFELANNFDLQSIALKKFRLLVAVQFVWEN